MATHADMDFHFGPAFAFETRRVLELPARVAERADAVITDNGRVSLRRQLIETGLVIGVVSELVFLFVALGW